MFDIDNFKSINDTYGHDIGDKVIISLSNEVLQKIRQSDIAARWGGEEFLILLPNTNQQGAIVLAEKIRLAIEKLHLEEVDFTVSVGVASFDITEDENIDDAIKKADLALYEAKNSGKNKVCLHI
jgi:diguanylate cyclase (GGDEF)-like protein